MAKPLIRIVYWPKDDKQGRRHTSFLRWDTITPPPKDFGRIESVSVVDEKKKAEEFTLVKPSKADIAIIKKALKKHKKAVKPRKESMSAAEQRMLDHCHSQYGEPIGKCATGECGHDDSSWCERK